MQKKQHLCNQDQLKVTNKYTNETPNQHSVAQKMKIQQNLESQNMFLQQKPDQKSHL